MYGVETKNPFSALVAQSDAKKPSAPKQEAAAPAKTAAAPGNAVRPAARSGDKPRSERRGPKAGKPREGKRTHDRRSGTGRPKNETKKGNYGKGNWGKAGSEAEPLPVVEEKPEAEMTAEELEERAAREREEKYVTLSEYEKQRQQKLAELPALPEARKPNDGDANAWKGFKKIEKVDEDAVVAAAFGIVAPKKAGKAKKQAKKAPVRIQPAFAVRDDSRPDRRDNRRDGKGKERRAPRGGAKKLALDDDKSFPSLGGK